MLTIGNTRNADGHGIAAPCPISQTSGQMNALVVVYSQHTMAWAAMLPDCVNVMVSGLCRVAIARVYQTDTADPKFTSPPDCVHSQAFVQTLLSLSVTVVCWFVLPSVVDRLFAAEMQMPTLPLLSAALGVSASVVCAALVCAVPSVPTEAQVAPAAAGRSRRTAPQ